MKRIIAALIVSLFALASVAASGAGKDPKGTDAFVYSATTDYEQKSPGLGFSYRFSSKNGWADEYHYDSGKKWKDGLNDEVDKHFGGNIMDISKAQDMGVYKTAVLANLEKVKIGGLDFHHAHMRLEFPDERWVESHIFLTARKGKLLKYRVSLNEPVEEATRKSVNDFIAFRVKEMNSGRK